MSRILKSLNTNIILLLSICLVSTYLFAIPHKKYIPDLQPVSADLSTHPFQEAYKVSIASSALPGNKTQDNQASHISEGTSPVFESTQSDPFTMFALTWTDDITLHAHFRAERTDGTWSPWYEADMIETTIDEPIKGTDLIFLQATKKVQVLFDDDIDPNTIGGLSMVFIDGKSQQGIAPMAYTSTEQLRLIPRVNWGADESIRCKQPTYDDRVSAITIHHTVGSNDYSPSDSSGIMRGIYTYHARTLGWCDIGYQALVDKYGNIFEGAYGGIDRAVRGTHAGGFNQNTWAISMMGTFTDTAPTNDMLQAVGNLAGWKAAISGFDPRGNGVHYSEGSSYTRYPLGTAVTLPNIFAHRDVGNTECPGNAAYPRMNEIRNIASARYNATRLGQASTVLSVVQAPGGGTVGSLSSQGQSALFVTLSILLVMFILGVVGSNSGNNI